MIGYLRGTVLHKEEGEAILDAGGVGFELTLTTAAFDALPAIREVGELFVHTLVREEEISLFGFATRDERRLFEFLMTVSGVGPRNALAIVCQLDENQIVEALASANPLPFTRVKGIGKKTAERIVLDLKGKVGKLFAAASARSGRGGGAALAGNLLEVEGALAALGYKRADIMTALEPLRQKKDAPVEELLRDALRRMTR